jgi:hypothetical protein
MQKLTILKYVPILMLVSILFAPDYSNATQITISTHGEKTFTLLNAEPEAQGRTADNLEIFWLKGTKIRLLTPDGNIFTQGDVYNNGELGIFHLAGSTQGGLPVGGKVNLTFLTSFATGSEFEIKFSYKDELWNPQFPGETSIYTEKLQPVPEPSSFLLLLCGVIGFVTIKKRSKR